MPKSIKLWTHGPKLVHEQSKPYSVLNSGIMRQSTQLGDLIYNGLFPAVTASFFHQCVGPNFSEKCWPRTCPQKVSARTCPKGDELMGPSWQQNFGAHGIHLPRAPQETSKTSREAPFPLQIEDQMRVWRVRSRHASKHREKVFKEIQWKFKTGLGFWLEMHLKICDFVLLLFMVYKCCILFVWFFCWQHILLGSFVDHHF